MSGYDDESKFLCDCGNCAYVKAGNSCSPRICFKTKERAMQFGKQFVDLFNGVFFNK